MKRLFHFLPFILLSVALWSCSDDNEPMSVETEKEHVSEQTFYEIIPNTKWQTKWRRFTDFQGNEYAETNILATLSFDLEFDENGFIVAGDRHAPTHYNEKSGCIENHDGFPMYYVAYLTKDRLILYHKCIFGSVYDENSDNEVQYVKALERIVYEPM